MTMKPAKNRWKRGFSGL